MSQQIKRRNQPSSIKSDVNKICKNVKQTFLPLSAVLKVFSFLKIMYAQNCTFKRVKMVNGMFTYFLGKIKRIALICNGFTIIFK